MGLGPMFNRVSCSGCHTKDGRGRPPENDQGPMDSMLLRISIPGKSANGGVVPHPVYGDQISERAILHVAPEGRAEISYTEIPGTYADGETFSLRQPDYAISGLNYGPLGSDHHDLAARRARHDRSWACCSPCPMKLYWLWQTRTTKTLTGFLAAPTRCGIPGRRKPCLAASAGKPTSPICASRMPALPWATSASPHPWPTRQNCSAAQTDCAAAINGGTPEMSDEFLEKLTLYTMTLAVPAQRNATDPQVKHGEGLFRAMGCASCHMPTLQTKEVENFPELSNQTFHPFTDLLLHDMGEGLADNRTEFQRPVAASGAPLRCGG